MVKKQWTAASLVVLFMLLATVQPEAQNRRRGRGRPVYRPALRVAFVGGYGPRFYGGPGYYRMDYRGGGHYGTVDFNVTPKESQVHVDGALIGSADDFNGGIFGSTARLLPGTHEIKIVAPDGTQIERRIFVMPGRELNFNYRF